MQLDQEAESQLKNTSSCYGGSGLLLSMSDRGLRLVMSSRPLFLAETAVRLRQLQPGALVQPIRLPTQGRQIQSAAKLRRPAGIMEHHRTAAGSFGSDHSNVQNAAPMAASTSFQSSNASSPMRPGSSHVSSLDDYMSSTSASICLPSSSSISGFDPTPNSASGISAEGGSATSHSAHITTSAISGIHASISSDVNGASATPASDLLGPAPLKRNMACLTCRKRKLRCDAAKPVCGTCAKSRAVAAANNHPPPIPHGDCIYGDSKLDESLVADKSLPSKRSSKRGRDTSLLTSTDPSNSDVLLRAKDQQIAELEQQIRHLQLAVSQQPSVHRSNSGSAPIAKSHSTTSPDDDHPPPSASVPGLGSSDIPHVSSAPDPKLELLWSGYPKDLPPPDTVLHLAEIFFTSSPYRNLIYKPGFMASLMLPPNHPNRPHAGLLHAIIAVAIPLSPFFRPSDENEDPARKLARIHKRIDLVVGMGTSPPSAAPSSKRDVSNLSFSEYHLALARQKSEMALLTGSPNPLDWCQALVLVSYQLRVDERALEGYLMAACGARLSTPAGLTRMNVDRTEAETLPNSYMTPPTTALEEHERRSYFWHLYIIEAYTSGGVQFWHSTYNDKDIITTLPIRMDDFQRGLDPPPNLQSLHSPDLYSNLAHDDDFLLHLKSVILCRRTYALLAKHNLNPSLDVTQIQEYREVEKDLLAFWRKMPQLDFSVTVQVERLVAVLNIHTIIIHLYQDMKGRGSYTTRPEIVRRLQSSISAVVQIAHNLNASNFDMGLLHFRTFNGLGVTAKVICHQINDILSAPQEPQLQATHDRILIEASQALDSIMMVLRRSKDKIPYAGRFVALLSKFRGGGWDKQSIERSMAVYHVYKSQRDHDSYSKPDPKSGKTGDLWAGDDRMSDSWRLRTTKYEHVTSAHGVSPATSGSATTPGRSTGVGPSVLTSPPAPSAVPSAEGDVLPASLPSAQAAPVPHLPSPTTEPFVFVDGQATAVKLEDEPSAQLLSDQTGHIHELAPNSAGSQSGLPFPIETAADGSVYDLNPVGAYLPAEDVHAASHPPAMPITGVHNSGPHERLAEDVHSRSQHRHLPHQYPNDQHPQHHHHQGMHASQHGSTGYSPHFAVTNGFQHSDGYHRGGHHNLSHYTVPPGTSIIAGGREVPLMSSQNDQHNAMPVQLAHPPYATHSHSDVNRYADHSAHHGYEPINFHAHDHGTANGGLAGTSASIPISRGHAAPMANGHVSQLDSHSAHPGQQPYPQALRDEAPQWSQAQLQNQVEILNRWNLF
ncbi:hypothetical protein BCV70DRAFT_206296 [Testicularia cyperi]|uniref:Zn(2)-C6 fungal-type domain-containing protein n=1 Tax=Testicularia cyperi TaxID=1882483 RepID=A0A317XQ26_9BASI|nr:hypothetical protein BCV70DRAFT_206296 [Testicularia cyperi]